MAFEALEQMSLPDSLVYYWMACFYANFMPSRGSIDFSANRDVFFVPNGKFGNRLFPYPFKFVAPYRLKADHDEKKVPYNLEISMELTSGELWEEANKFLREYREDDTRNYPTLGFMHKAKVKPSEVARASVRRFRDGVIDFPGLLREEWWNSETQLVL